MPFDETYDSAPAEFDPDAESEEPTALAEAEEPEVEEDDLSQLDGDTRALVEKWYTGQQEKQRESFREYGIDLNREGRPLVADANRLAGWAGVASAPQQQQQQPTPAQQAAQQQPVVDDEDASFDPLSATADDYRRLAQREAAKLLAPMQQENARLTNLLQSRAASEAVQQVRASVEARLPGLAPMLDHPDFAAAYQHNVSGMPAESLGDPVFIASIAAATCAQLDPARLPAPKARDDAGRFATQQQAEAIARTIGQRGTLAGTPPSRGGAGGRNQPDSDAERGARILGHIRSQLSPDLARRFEATPDSWQRAQYTNFDQWQESKRLSEAATNNGGRKR